MTEKSFFQQLEDKSEPYRAGYRDGKAGVRLLAEGKQQYGRKAEIADYVVGYLKGFSERKKGAKNG